MTAPLDCFAVAAPGLEPLVLAELEAQGIRGTVVEGGVEWKGSMASLALANLWLRTASRVVVRLGTFRARTFFELERHARKLPWGQFMTAGTPVDFRVTCKKSKLYHSDAVAQRFQEAVAHALGSITVAPMPGEEELEGADAQLCIVRFSHDVCTVSLDSSGELLHRRGYRQAVGKAPLRETLGAAMLLGAGWRGDTPFVDPMCGAGTLAIEAAMIARRLPPGGRRSFAFQRWPGHHEGRWRELVGHAMSAARQRSTVPIAGSDRDAGAIESARANAERAGVGNDIIFTEQVLSAARPTGPTGLLATNPPYGVRVGDVDRLRNLYAQIGHLARERFAGWTVALLSADSRLESQLQMPLEEKWRSSNGGIPVHLVVGQGDVESAVEEGALTE
jgi:putative N6-adenine-specific DNA methylase